MNVRVLIDAIVRQNMVLVAQLSTTAGLRAPLAHVANQVFLDLVRELEAQGVRQKVIADMFGLALRSYQRKVQRLLESETDHGRSLWEAVLSHVRQEGVVSRADVLRRFRFDDESMVRGVLDDLVNTGLVYRRGKRERTVFRAADDSDLAQNEADREQATAALVWVTVYREAPVTRAELVETLRLEPEDIEGALTALIDDGRVVAQETEDGDALYETNAFFTAYGEPSGWEAALFDHYQAVVNAIVRKLAVGRTNSARTDRLGGSTYSFDVWEGHPFEERVFGLLGRVRREADALIEDVHRYNSSHPHPASSHRVTFYVGQSYRTDDVGGGDE